MTAAAPEPSRKINYLPLSKINSNPRNPKDHDLELIDGSIGRFGYIEPVILDGRTGMIISGHGRVKTLTSMHDRQESPPEGIVIDASGEWSIPVVDGWSSRTDAEANAAIIALNRTSEVGGWVDDQLLELLDELAESGEGFQGVGFDEHDREALDALLHNDDSQRDLDKLAEEYGSPTDDDHLSKIVLNLPKDLADQLQDHLESYGTHAEAVTEWLDAIAVG